MCVFPNISNQHLVRHPEAVVLFSSSLPAYQCHVLFVVSLLSILINHGVSDSKLSHLSALLRFLFEIGFNLQFLAFTASPTKRATNHFLISPVDVPPFRNKGFQLLRETKGFSEAISGGLTLRGGGSSTRGPALSWPGDAHRVCSP